VRLGLARQPASLDLIVFKGEPLRFDERHSPPLAICARQQRLARQPEPPTLVTNESGCFNIGDIESRLPLRARGVANLRPLVVLLGKSLGRRSASKTTDRRDRDGNDLLSWQAFVARERAPCSEREKVADHRVECTATAASGLPA